jgi:putative transposase
MPHRRIYIGEQHAHFVTLSCYKRRRLLDHDSVKRVVLGCLSAQLQRLAAVCVGFVIMPDHVHTLLWFPEQEWLSQLMEHWKQASSARIKNLVAAKLPAYAAHLPPEEPIWQARYYDFNVISCEKAEEKLRYMHENPVKGGLVERAVDWPWSSARYYELGRSVGVPIARLE